MKNVLIWLGVIFIYMPVFGLWCAWQCVKRHFGDKNP